MIWLYAMCVVATTVWGVAAPFGVTSINQLRKLQERSGLELTDTVRPRVVSRLRWGVRVSALGAIVVGTAAALAILPLTNYTSRLENGVLALLVVAFVVGGALADFIFLAVTDRRSWSPQQPEAASRAPRLRDYIGRRTGLSVGGVLMYFALALGYEIVLVANDHLRLPVPVAVMPPSIALAVALVMVVSVVLAGRALIRRDTFTGSNEDRAWNDALRAEQLRGLLYSAVPPTAIAFYFTSLGNTRPVGSDTTGWWFSVTILALIGWGASLFTNPTAYRRGTREWLGALWPEIADAAQKAPFPRAQPVALAAGEHPDFPFAQPITAPPPELTAAARKAAPSSRPVPPVQ